MFSFGYVLIAKRNLPTWSPVAVVVMLPLSFLVKSVALSGKISSTFTESMISDGGSAGMVFGLTLKTTLTEAFLTSGK